MDKDEELRRLFEPRRHMEMVDLKDIEANICTKKECLANGNPHRHTVAECKEHPYCIDEPLREDLKTFTVVP